MRSRRSRAERARSAISPWLPFGRRQLAWLTLIITAALVFGLFAH